MSLFVPTRPAVAASTPAVSAGYKAGPLGPGAGPLMTEWLLPMILPGDNQRKAARAMALGDEVPYVRMAERAISGQVAGSKLLPGAGWHLEDPDGDTIDEDYADARAVEAWRLIDDPFLYSGVVSPLRTRRHLWDITSRHMGLAGYGFWFKDQMDEFGIPRSILYIRPDRILPKCDSTGTITTWVLDPKPGPGGEATGTDIALDELVQFQLQAPSVGYLPTGLIESAIMKVQLSGAIDKHFATLISGGGRLSGIISPKQGTIDDDGVYEQMVRDWRNITEQPESGKRVQIVRGPIEFTRTTQTTVEMALVDFLKANEADLLTVWGVPLSQLGGYTPSGLNSGDVRKYDRQAMWENAVIPRLSEIAETMQTQILDKFKPLLGWAPRLVVDIPALEDDSPRYDKLQKAQFIAMTNDERRDLIGRDPLDPAKFGDAGEQILIPNTLIPLAQAGMVTPAPFGDTGRPGSPPAAPVGAPTPSGQGEPNDGAPEKSGQAVAAAGGQKAKTGLIERVADAGKTKKDVTPAVLAALRKQWTPDELDKVAKGKWRYDPAFPLTKIDAARRPIARNPKIVQGVEAAIAVGAPFDPVVLVKTKRVGGSGGKPTEPIDGWHRLLAAEHSGIDTVPAFIGSGDDDWTRAMIAIDDALPTPADGPSPVQRPRAKASLRSSIVGLRQTLESTVTQPLRVSVSAALETMKRDVVSRVLANFEHIKRKPGDTSSWWKAEEHDAALERALTPALSDVVDTVSAHVRAVVPAPAGKAAVWMGGPPASNVVTHVLNRGAGRVTRINQTTRDALKEIIAGGVEDGLSPAELGDAVELWSGWDEYRAERIASTELMFAYNAAATETYRDMGVQEVEALDGDDDPECAERNGQTFTVDDAESIEDHPNGTLDWIPIVPDEEG